ncbi:MAG: hypothetical protein SOW59_04660 [Corynebacterium sp.]|nr:hypothetical protein [Corynebacterium sp.]
MTISAFSKSSTRRLGALALAGVLVFGSTGVASAQSSASAQLADVTTLSSTMADEAENAAARLSSGLPAPVKQAAAQFGITLPGANAHRAIRAQLQSKTTEHLIAQGHKPNAEAQSIATQWVKDAAAGSISFKDGVGHGAQGKDKGTGNILRLTPAQAQDRVGWLNRATNPHNTPTGFGVATASDGQFVYIAEFFLN